MESLYEEFSLFDRDLLPATGSVSNKNANFLSRDVGEEWLPIPEGGGDDTLSINGAVLFPELMSPASPPGQLGGGSVPEPNWLDTQTNLIGFLGDSNVVSPQPVVETPPVSDTDIVSFITDVSAISQQAEKMGYEIVCIPSSPKDSDHTGGEENLEMSLLDVVNNLAGSLEEEDSVLNEVIEQPQQLPMDSILSPISVEDVESLLSSGPASPSSTFEDSGFVDDLSDDPSYSPGPVKGSRQHASERPAPYHKRGPKTSCSDSKQRKKIQNKDAALRYRQKKKAESKSAEVECAELEKKNEELKDKVDGLSREIGYLKDLMSEVYKAKGLALPSILSSTNI